LSEFRLEPWGEGDLTLLERLLGDPAMTEHLGGPESEEKIASRHQKYLGLRGDSPDKMFKIVDAATGEAVGSVGYWERELPDEMAYETGWSVLPEHQGPVRGQRGVERDLPQAWVRARRDGRVRVPAGQREDHALQQLAARALLRRRLRAT
jgi:hypothetical protein